MRELDKDKSSDEDDSKKKASVFQVAQAVLFSFIGIRKKSDLEYDAARIKPLQVVIGGLVGGTLFVLSILLIVRFVTS